MKLPNTPTLPSPSSAVSRSKPPPSSFAQQALRQSARAIANGSKSFALAARLLPRHVRDSAMVFYAYCRRADDAIDHSPQPALALDQLHRQLDRVFSGRPSDELHEQALAALIEVHRLPRAPFDYLLEGFAWDAQGRTYTSMHDTMAYGVRVAGTVGIVMAAIMGRRDRVALARACDLGVAMQLTNICRDVGEDAKMGRVYLPDNLLREQGLSTSDLKSDKITSKVLAPVIRELLRQAATLYGRAHAGIALLPPKCQPAILAAAAIYAAIGDEIQRADFDVLKRRAVVSRWKKATLAWRAWRAKPDYPVALLAEPVLSCAQALVEAALIVPDTLAAAPDGLALVEASP